MRRFLLTGLILLFLAQTADAQTYYMWRKRSHATDITTITDGKAADLGLEEDSNTLWRWNTATSAWNQVSIPAEADPVASAINGLLKSDGTTLSAAVADTDYLLPATAATTYLPLTGGSLTGALNITPSTDVVPLTIKGGGAGTADLFEAYDPTNNTLRTELFRSGAQSWYIGAAGVVGCAIHYSTPGGYPGIIGQYPSGTNLWGLNSKSGMAGWGRTGESGFQHFTGGCMTLGTSSSTSPADAQFHIYNSTGTTKVTFILDNQASQTGDSQRWRNSARTVLAAIDVNGAFIFNEQGADADSRIEGDTDPNLFYVDAGADGVCIGNNAADGKFEIQTTSTWGLQAFTIDQDDADQAFIDFQGTSAADATNNISTWTTGNAIQGFVKVEINGGAYWMPYYDAPTS